MATNINAIERSLTLSTAHVPGNALVPGCDDGAVESLIGDFRIVSHQYGWIVFMHGRPEPGERGPDMPAWFEPIARLAWRYDCSLVHFDRDASTLDGLETFDW